jgi:hypothetical protein
MALLTMSCSSRAVCLCAQGSNSYVYRTSQANCVPRSNDSHFTSDIGQPLRPPNGKLVAAEVRILTQTNRKIYLLVLRRVGM